MLLAPKREIHAPLSCFGGSPAAEGISRYSCTTSVPATEPVFLRSTLIPELLAYKYTTLRQIHQHDHDTSIIECGSP
jgi:hypothetical protein